MFGEIQYSVVQSNAGKEYMDWEMYGMIALSGEERGALTFPCLLDNSELNSK